MLLNNFYIAAENNCIEKFQHFPSPGHIGAACLGQADPACDLLSCPGRVGLTWPAPRYDHAYLPPSTRDGAGQVSHPVLGYRLYVCH